MLNTPGDEGTYGSTQLTPRFFHLNLRPPFDGKEGGERNRAPADAEAFKPEDNYSPPP